MAPSKVAKSTTASKAKKEKVCHPSSRKAGQLARTALRKSKMGDLASKRSQREDHQLSIFSFFYHAMPPSGVLSLEDMHTVIRDVWLTRFDEELQAESASRRKGRPKSMKEMKLEEMKLRAVEEYRTGIEVPDLTHPPTVELFRRWDQKEVAFIQLLRFIRISSANPTMSILSRPGKHASILSTQDSGRSEAQDSMDVELQQQLLPFDEPPDRFASTIMAMDGQRWHGGS